MTQKISYICEFCNKEFTTKTNLNYHLKNTATCAKKKDIDIYKCEGCERELCSKKSLMRHQKTCLCAINKHICGDEYEKQIHKIRRKHKKNIENIFLNHKKEFADYREKMEKSQQQNIEESRQQIENIKKEKIETYEKQLESNEKRIEYLEKEVERLTKALTDIASQPSVVNNAKNITITHKKLRNIKCTKIKPLTEETVKTYAPTYDYETFKKGLKP